MVRLRNNRWWVGVRRSIGKLVGRHRAASPRLHWLLGAATAALVTGTVWAAAVSGGSAIERADPADVYSPVAAGEDLPDGFFQVVPRDLIAPVYEPDFVAAVDAGWPDDTDVIGVWSGDEAKAYPVSLLNSREMVIDELAGVPIVVTWCPLCGTALVHERVVAGETLVFGVQGALYLNAMTWWDHDTGSIWSQPLGRAIMGPRAGATVELLPSEFTTWGAWRDAHPATKALDAPGRATDFDLADFLVVIDLGVEARGYGIADLRTVGVANDVVADVPLAVVSDPRHPDRWAVFDRRVGRAVVELEVDGDMLRDRLTGTTFHPVLGSGLGGPLAGETLERLPAALAVPGGGPMRVPVFGVFWPGAERWRP